LILGMAAIFSDPFLALNHRLLVLHIVLPYATPIESGRPAPATIQDCGAECGMPPAR